MLVDRIEIRHVGMPMPSPFRTAFGDEWTIESLLVKLGSGDVEAWGESTPFSSPAYSPEWAGGAFLVLRDYLAPAVIGREVASGEELQALLAHVKGNQFARAALDTAWWALAAKLADRPLHELLAGTRDRVEVGADFGVLDSMDELIEAVGRAVDADVPRVKLKFRPGWDVEMVRAVRSAFPDLVVHVDCNSAYTLANLDLFRRIDGLGLAMIEQPLQHDDLLDHATLQGLLETPVCLDESITTLRRAEQAIELGSCRYVNLKPGRVGGLTNAVAIHDVCREAGIPCWVGGMLESQVGAGVCVALATLPNFTYPADIFPSERFYEVDLAEPHVEFEGWSALPGPLPEPDPVRLEELTIQRAAL